MSDTIVGPGFLRDRSRRRCPGCKTVKTFNPATGGGDFYVRRRLVPEFAVEGRVTMTEELIASVYCRNCTSSKNSDQAQEETDRPDR